MKKNLSLTAFLLLNLCFLTFFSCSKDDDTTSAKPSIDLDEVGMGDNKTVMANTGLHVEADVFAEALVQSIKISIVKKDDASKSIEFNYTSGKYIGIKNTEFHEHILIPESTIAGEYTLRFTVVDKLGQSSTEECNLTITAYDQNCPIVELTYAGTDSEENKGVIGQTMNIKAHISAGNGIKKIIVEFHNADTDVEDEMDLTGTHAGKTALDFDENITIPSTYTAGNYHIHFTVIDNNNESVTEEKEDVTIVKK